MKEKSMTHGIKFKDKIGYAMGDMGGLLTFSLIGAFQNKFYTDVLHISPAKIMVLILVARLWDAINDPIWGHLSIQENRHGRVNSDRTYSGFPYLWQYRQCLCLL